MRIGFLLTAILSSTPYCIPVEGLRRELFGDGRISAQGAQVAEHERTVVVNMTSNVSILAPPISMFCL